MNSISRRSRRRKTIAEINVVPYLDVTLVLLIIFMLTAPLQQTAVEVNLPATGGVIIQKKEPASIIISIQKDGQYFLSEKEKPEQAVPLTKLLSRIAKLYKTNPQTQIYIKGDTTVEYGKIVSVMAALKEAGVPHVGLMTRSPEL